MLLLQRAIARRCSFTPAPSRAGKLILRRAVLARAQDRRHGAAGDSASGVSDPVHSGRATRPRQHRGPTHSAHRMLTGFMATASASGLLSFVQINKRLSKLPKGVLAFPRAPPRCEVSASAPRHCHICSLIPSRHESTRALGDVARHTSVWE